MGSPLHVLADLSLLIDAKAFSVKGSEELITVELPNLWSGRSMLKPWFNRRRRKKMIEKLYRGLMFTDLTLEFRVAQRLIALMGSRAQPSILSRLLGLGALELKPMPLLLSLFRK